MGNSTPHGRFQLCLDMALDERQTSLSAHRTMVRLVERCAAQCDRHAIPLTWAVPAATVATVGDILCSSTARHEIALLFDVERSSVARAEFASTLGDRLDRARETGWTISSLVLPGALSRAYADLIGKMAITVTRDRNPAPVWPRRLRESLRHRRGVWNIPATALFPGRGHVLGWWDCGFRAKQALWRAVHRQEVEHVAVSAAFLVSHAGARHRFDSLLSFLARFQAIGRLRCETLCQAIAKWCPTANAKRSQSILKPAA
jgi:hypothetical protein